MPSLHMPLQSGSSRLLKEMRRSYRQQKFLDIISRVKEAIPDAAITTDIIVGFPGETEEDFLDTLHVVRESRFSGAFTFQYSKRPGTPAADLPSVDPAVIADRYQRLTALQTQIGLEENEKQVGRVVEVMVASGEGRRDGDTGRLSGRAPDNRLVHFNGVVPAGLADGRGEIRPGDMVTVAITRGAPHYLEADGEILGLRRTRSGDAWDRRNGAPAEAPAGVGLGMPAIGVPAPLPPVVGCG
jgi:tRNA-2-methylthio-N6-dimethylallyladenosine synthase